MQKPVFNHISKPFTSTTILIVFFILPIYFQNCADVAGPSTKFVASSAPYHSETSSMDSTHLNEIQLKNTYQKILVVNRFYLAQFFREIFTNAKYPYPLEFADPRIDLLDRIIYENITRKGTFFGGPCDPNDSHSTSNCNGGVADASLPSFIESNSVRASYVIQVCEQTLSARNPAGTHFNQGILALLENINAVDTEPETESLTRLYQLFFRFEDPSTNYIQSLIELNDELKQQNESLISRWKSIALVVCESPGWQVL